MAQLLTGREIVRSALACRVLLSRNSPRPLEAQIEVSLLVVESESVGNRAAAPYALAFSSGFA